MRAGQRVRPAASNGSAAHPRAGVGTLLRGRAADATRGPAMRIPSRHAQDRQRTRTHTRHPQEQQATAHAPTDAREWCRDITDMARKVNRVVDPPQTRVVFDACPFCRHGIVWSTPRAHMGGCKSCGAHK